MFGLELSQAKSYSIAFCEGIELEIGNIPMTVMWSSVPPWSEGQELPQSIRVLRIYIAAHLQ